MFSTHQRKIEMRNLKRLYRSNYSIFLSKSQNLKRVQEERQIKISGISDHLIEVKQTKKNSGRKSRSKVCCRRGIYPRWRLSLDQKHFNLAIKWSGKTVSPHNLNCIKKIRISVDACETVSNYSKVAAQKGKELLQGKFLLWSYDGLKIDLVWAFTYWRRSSSPTRGCGTGNFVRVFFCLSMNSGRLR